MKSCLRLALVCLLVNSVACLFQNSHSFEADLEPWSSLKRRAGYYTQSGRYRGGLYKKARDEEMELYECTSSNGRYCLSWTTRDRITEEAESGTCTCSERSLYYCASWLCVRREVRVDTGCGDDGCRNEIQEEQTTCTCTVASAFENYCKEWTCTEIGSDSAGEEEMYTCVEESESEQYCDRWTGDFSSKKELESSVCQCDTGAGEYCSRWTCKEREIKICDEYGSGWCNLPLAVGLAGGFGTVVTFGALAYVVFRFKKEPVARVACFMIAVAVLCLPWTAAVAIWGGVNGLLWVSLMWGVAFLISAVCLWLRRQD